MSLHLWHWDERFNLTFTCYAWCNLPFFFLFFFFLALSLPLILYSRTARNLSYLGHENTLLSHDRSNHQTLPKAFFSFLFFSSSTTSPRYVDVFSLSKHMQQSPRARMQWTRALWSASLSHSTHYYEVHSNQIQCHLITPWINDTSLGPAITRLIDLVEKWADESFISLSFLFISLSHTLSLSVSQVVLPLPLSDEVFLCNLFSVELSFRLTQVTVEFLNWQRKKNLLILCKIFYVANGNRGNLTSKCFKVNRLLSQM